VAQILEIKGTNEEKGYVLRNNPTTRDKGNLD